ncbi:MAG: hypothetical protein QHJ34_14960 [bacterium]|nr:hypothetical protein [bacterium]
MRRMVRAALVFGLALLVACAGGMASLQEPVEGKHLLIGSVIFENSGYQNRNDVYFANVEVAVIGYSQEDGKEKLFGKWVVADENGYFFIPNVPDGKYALKGLRVNMPGVAFLTIANEFRSTVSNYEIQPTETVAFSGTFFDIGPENRIVNLKHNYFTLFSNREIRHGAYDRISAFTASNGQEIERPPIFQYFLEKFPHTGWRPFLEAELARVR